LKNTRRAMNSRMLGMEKGEDGVAMTNILFAIIPKDY